MPNQKVGTVKALYYKALCLFLSPKGMGYNPYRHNRVKFAVTKAVPGSNHTAADLCVRGMRLGPSYRGWVKRKAIKIGVGCWTFGVGSKYVNVLLVGPAHLVEMTVSQAWKGPGKSDVERVRVRWFNKPVISRGENQQEESLSPSAIRSIQSFKRTFASLEPLLKSPNQNFAETRVTAASEIERAAKKIALFVSRFGHINYIMSPIQSVGFHKSQSSRVSSMLRAFSSNKQMTKDYLSKQGLPVPSGDIFVDWEDAKSYFTQCRSSLAVKPVLGSHGAGVTVDVNDEKKLKIAWDYAKQYHRWIVLEEFVPGIDIRVLVVGGRAVAALSRFPANVVGDGRSTIRELIHQKNKWRLTNPRLRKAPIIMDSYKEDFLLQQGYSFESVPQSGEIVLLHMKANIEAGGDSISVADFVHPDLLQLAEEAAQSFPAQDFWGIDLVVDRIDLPRSQDRCKIIEVNSRANIFNVHYPLYGKPVDVARALVDYVFDDDFAEACPQQSVQVAATGLFDKQFELWAGDFADKLDIKYLLERDGDKVSLDLSGCRNNILRYSSDVLEWKSQAGFVDNLAIHKSNKWGKETISLADVYEQSTASAQKIGSLDRAAANRALLKLEFGKHGYTPEETNDQELIGLEKNGCRSITGVRFSSIFCDKIAQEWHIAKKLLCLNGVPVCRGLLFKTGDFDGAVDYYSYLVNRDIVPVISGKNFAASKLCSEQHLRNIWSQAKNLGVKAFLLEELVPGNEVVVAVVAGRAVAALIKTPVTVVGDGHKTISQLVEDKNHTRRNNPLYRHHLLSLKNKESLETLKRLQLTPKTVIAQGVHVELEDRVEMHLGGETSSISESLHADFFSAANQAVNCIPGLEFANVHLIIPDYRKPALGQKWVVSGISTDPSIAEFHFPLQGRGRNVAECVAKKLCLDGNMLLL